MADYRGCIAALARAAGRALTDDEVAAIFERVHKAALDIKAGRVEVEDVGMPKKLGSLREDVGDMAANELIQAAAERAARELEIEANERIRRANLQMTVLGARIADVESLSASGFRDLDAVDRIIARDYSGRANIASLEQHVFGHQTNFLRQLLPAWDALGDDFLGLFQDRVKMLNLIKEIRGEDTGNALARRGAKAWLDVAEEARKTFNEAGGHIGRLDDWGLPQHHSQERVSTVGREEWINQVLPYLDRAKYVDELTGQAWDDAELREFLGHAWETIATNGWNKVVPGQGRGFGSRAGRHAEHRQIHFKDAESLIAYWELFGERSLVEIMHDHIGTMARDIGFIEYFGPDPNMTYQTLRDAAMQHAAIADPVKTPQLEAQATRLDNLYDYAAGRKKPTFRPWLRKTAEAIANANVFGKLGSAAITSFFGDKPIFEAVSHLNNLPAFKRWGNEIAMLNPLNGAERRLLQRQGLMLDVVRSGLQRFGEDLGYQRGITGKTANAVMTLTGMQAVNEFRKGAFGLTLMDSIGYEISRGVDFNQLADSDIRVLKTFGVTEMDWNTWKLAELDDLDRGNNTVLTPEAISRITDDQLRQANIIGQLDGAREAEAARRNAIVKLLGAVNTESEFAVVTPGWRERALFYGAIQRGTVPGEIWRSILQFKTFPFTMFARSLDAVANKENGAGKAGMTAFLLVGTTLAGAMTMQTKEILAGKDPRKMMDENWYKFWGSAFIYGGALGFYGDFLYSVNQTRYGSGPIEALSGPTLGPLLELALVQPLGAARKMIEGEETNLASQTIGDVKGFIPFNNAWYAKGAIDHLVWNNVMETLNPGYLRRMKRRTAKEYDQEWWWEPGTMVPQRPPDMASAVQ